MGTVKVRRAQHRYFLHYITCNSRHCPIPGERSVTAKSSTMRKRASRKDSTVGGDAHAERAKTIHRDDRAERPVARKTVSGSWAIYAEITAQVILTLMMTALLTSFVNERFSDNSNFVLSPKIDTLMNTFKNDLEKIEELKQIEVFNTYQKK